MTFPAPTSEPIRIPPRSPLPLRRTLGLALAGVSAVAFGLTLALLSAGAGIEQRLILVLGLLLIMGLVIALALDLARRILRPLEELDSWLDTAANSPGTALPVGTPGAAGGELGVRVSRLVDSIRRFESRPATGAPGKGVPESASSASEELTRLRTELLQLQELVVDMERMSTRGKMAGDIAHEINNFLTILGGNLDIIPMLLASGNQEKVFAKFAAMRQTLDKIARFSNGLVGYRDNESEPGPCDLNRQVEDLVAFLKPQNRFDGIECSLQCDPRLPMIQARAGQIQQVLVSLLNNAADAAREANPGGGNIELRTNWLPEHGLVAISVKDNGTGLSDRARSHIFKERYSDKKSGHGLGLLNGYRIAQAHGGTLSVESLGGQGTTFTLALPAEAEAVLVSTAGKPSTLEL